MEGIPIGAAIGRLLAILTTGATLAACGLAPVPIGGEPAPVPEGPIRFESVELADDGRSVRVDFVGGPEFDPADPCSLAYEGTATIIGEELEIGIRAMQHPKAPPPRMGCGDIGHPRTLELELERPFTGSVVRDLAGQVFHLEPPTGLARIGSLPAGWELRRQGNVLGTTTPRWERVWSPDRDPWPAEGDSMLVLIQAFGGPVATTGGDVRRAAEVNGGPALLSVHPPAGEMVVVWSLGDDELALVGNLADFTEADFIRIAESVALP